MKNSLQNLDPITIPLTGNSLIEASAGTGKTYSITLLYIRLLLGLDHKQIPLMIDQILVVTFTKAATAELKNRIRKRLTEMLLLLNHLDDKESIQYDKTLDRIVIQIENYQLDYNLCKDLLTNAISRIDQASIFTIHGFCRHVLSQNTLHSHIPINIEFSSNIDPLIEEACREFWRVECYQLNEFLAYWFHVQYRSPNRLKDDIKIHFNQLNVSETSEAFKIGDGLIINPELPLIHQRNQSILDALINDYLAEITLFKHAWFKHRQLLVEIANHSGLDQRKYGKKVNIRAAQIDAILSQTKLTEGSLNLLAYSPFEYFCQTNVEKAIKKGVTIEIPECFLIYEEHYQKIKKQYEQLNNVLINMTFYRVNFYLKRLKYKHQTIGFDDLLYFCYLAISSSKEQLPIKLRTQFPTALIDEFQDTDALQYKIFNTIYSPKALPYSKNPFGLIMIGDPKQSIYAFRGADISTYLKAKENIATTSQHTLNENFRSSGAVCRGINALFSNTQLPFMESQIPFIKIAYPPKSDLKNIVFDAGNTKTFQKGLHLSLFQAEKGEKNSDEYIANFYAQKINNLLKFAKEGVVYTEEPEEHENALLASLKKSDITENEIVILVKNNKQADLIRSALNHYQIKSTYLSEKNVVYQQNIAYQLYLILIAVYDHKSIDKLKHALSTPVFSLTLPQIALLFSNEKQLEDYLFQSFLFHQTWRNKGVLAMIQQWANFQYQHGCIKDHLLSSQKGKRDFVNLLHLAELLQIQERLLPSIEALLSWFYTQIQDKSLKYDEEILKLRLEEQDRIIRIYTYHKSKGLEFPIVFIPFANQEYKTKRQKSIKIDYDQQEEWLKEELRLIYVAITRSIYQCYVGVKLVEKKITPLNYLIANQEQQESNHYSADIYREFFQKNKASLELEEVILKRSVSDQLSLLIEDDLSEKNMENSRSHLPSKPVNFVANRFKRVIYQPWQYTSYTHLMNFVSQTRENNEVILWDENSEPITINSQTTTDLFNFDTGFLFPMGMKTGLFLHSILENLPSMENDGKKLNQLVLSYLTKYSIVDHPENWLEGVSVWISRIVSTRLSSEANVSISKLKSEQKLVEFEFIFPIRQAIESKNIFKLISQYYPKPKRFSYLEKALGRKLPLNQINFRNVKGMLKGIIDLLFEWDDKFYLLDYKSNHLGSSFEYYQPNVLYEDIKYHYYDLQFLIYSVALHRHLKSLLEDYDYEKNFGGVFYLYLRGMNGQNNQTGVYFTKPDYALIEQLDELFG